MNNEIVLKDLNYIFSCLSEQEKKKFNSTTILITGCGGFLGFYFLHFFLYFKEQLNIKAIIGLDIFHLGKSEWLKILEKEEPDNLKIYNFDIAKDDINQFKECYNANIIIHMASIASPVYYRKHPIQTLDANVWGLRKLLDLFKEKEIRAFLFFSSSEIYGDPLAEFVPTNEEYRGNVATMGPRACYDESKRFGETMCYLFWNQYKTPISIVRPFNNYGPGMRIDDRRVPADFANAIINNEDIVIYSSGSPTRTFCYVADAIVGYLKALCFAQCEYFNIGIDHPEISITELANIYVKMGKRIVGYNGNIRFETPSESNYLTHNPTRRCPDITKAKKILGYSPSITIEDGIERFILYLKSEKK